MITGLSFSSGAPTLYRYPGEESCSVGVLMSTIIKKVLVLVFSPPFYGSNVDFPAIAPNSLRRKLTRRIVNRKGKGSDQASIIINWNCLGIPSKSLPSFSLLSDRL